MEERLFGEHIYEKRIQRLPRLVYIYQYIKNAQVPPAVFSPQTFLTARVFLYSQYKYPLFLIKYCLYVDGFMLLEWT